MRNKFKNLICAPDLPVIPMQKWYVNIDGQHYRFDACNELAAVIIAQTRCFLADYYGECDPVPYDPDLHDELFNPDGVVGL